MSSTVVRCSEHLLPARQNGLCVSCEADRLAGEQRILMPPVYAKTCEHYHPDTPFNRCPACIPKRAARAKRGADKVREALEAALARAAGKDAPR